MKLHPLARVTVSLDELIPWVYGDLVHIVTEWDDLSALGAVHGDRVILRETRAPDARDYVEARVPVTSPTWRPGLHLRRWAGEASGYRLVAHIHLSPADVTDP